MLGASSHLRVGRLETHQVLRYEQQASKGNADNVNVAAYTVGGLMSGALLGLAAGYCED